MPQAIRVGFIGAGEYTTVTSGTKTVALRPLSTNSGLRAAKILDPSTGQYYYVEYRTRTGRDKLLYADSPAGVRVLRVDDREDAPKASVALDATPTGNPQDNNRLIPVGRTFTSYSGAVRITVKATTATSATLSVSVGASTVRTRSVSIAGAVTSGAAVNAGTQTGATAVFGWSGAPAGGRYDVQYRAVGATPGGAAAPGPARAWLTNTAATSGRLSGAFGGVYEVSSRVHTATGTAAWSAWARTTIATDAGTGATLRGRWAASRNAAYYAGTALATSVNGAALVRPAAAATTITVVGTRHPRGAVARVYVDGALKASVNTYAARVAVRQSLATVKVPAGRHVVTVVAAATSARPTLVLDAVAYGR